MAITIRHLEGPLAGREQHFDNSVEVITFGRLLECQVVYPPECSEVGRRHFALSRGVTGDYHMELFGNRYVAIDGVLAENGAVVTSGSVIRLGRPDGPSFRVNLGSEMAEIAWSTEDVDLPDDLMASLKEGPEDRLVDLLMKRKAQRTAVTAGLPADGFAEIVFSSIPGQAGARAKVRAKYAPETQMRMRRSSGSFWWVAIALGTAVIGYLLYRRDIFLGAVIGKLFYAAAPPPPAAKEESADLVDVSVFGPTAIQAGGEGLIQVFLHTLGQREIAKALAQEADPDAIRRGIQTLAAEIARGQRVEIIIEGRGLDVDQERQPLIWRGEPCACQFIVTAPKDSAERTFHPHIIVLVDSVPVGSITFALKVNADKAPKSDIELRGERARRYTYAFLSYASQDRAEVIKRAQGLRAGGTSFFNDLLSLEPGERWEKRLYQEIDRCDVFYLFWSSQAKASEWVMKETEYALARRAASGNGDPDIIPVLIEGPPPPARPESLKDIHFNDSLLYVLAGVQGQPPLAR